MFQVAYNYHKSWPETHPLRIESHVVQEITVSPDLARRKANSFLAGYVTMMVLAGEPMLILGERPVWRVPANLHLPNQSDVNTLGTIDVDAQTGQVIVKTRKQIKRLQELASVYAAYFTSSTRPTS